MELDTWRSLRFHLKHPVKKRQSQKTQALGIAKAVRTNKQKETLGEHLAPLCTRQWAPCWTWMFCNSWGEKRDIHGPLLPESDSLMTHQNLLPMTGKRRMQAPFHDCKAVTRQSHALCLLVAEILPSSSRTRKPQPPGHCPDGFFPSTGSAVGACRQTRASAQQRKHAAIRYG